MATDVYRHAVSMTDKLSALGPQRQPVELGSMEEATPEDAEYKEQISQVLSTVDRLTSDISRLVDLIEQIKINHTAFLAQFQNTEAQRENEKKQETVRKLSHHITDELKKLKLEIEKVDGGPARNTADFRIKKAQYATLSRKFRDVMQEYHQEEEQYRQKNKDMIQRQLKIAGKNVSDSKLEEMLEDDTAQIFTQDLLGNTKLLRDRQMMLTEVEARHLEILRLEQNIRELHDMFYDLSQLVYEQGELINQIEFNVEHASNFVQRSAVLVRQSATYKSSNRRLKWGVCILLSCVGTVVCIVLIAVIGAILAFTVFRDQSV